MEFLNSKHVLLLICVSIISRIYGVVTEGEMFFKVANVSKTDKDSNLKNYFLTLHNATNKIMKVEKGADGIWKFLCYYGPWYEDCKSNLTMPYHMGIVNITMTGVPKSFAGKHQLYSYHTGANGRHDPHPIVEFTLCVRDAPLTTMTSVHITTELPPVGITHTETKAPRAKSQGLGIPGLSFAPITVVSFITVFFMA